MVAAPQVAGAGLCTIRFSYP